MLLLRRLVLLLRRNLHVLILWRRAMRTAKRMLLRNLNVAGVEVHVV